MLSLDYQFPKPGAGAVADREVRATCALGSSVARVVVSWEGLEPAPGRISPGYATAVDRVINGLRRCGTRTELTLVRTPCWLTTDQLGCASPGFVSYPPRSTAPFGVIVAWALARWHTSLAALEVWNEPNSERFWRGSPQQYVALVNEATDAARSTGSRVPILAGAMAGADTGFLSQLYAAGLRGQGGISMHPYTLRSTGFINPVRSYGNRAKKAAGARPWSVFRRGIGKVRATMLAAGDRTGVWLTEFGYSVCPAVPLCVSARRQASWIAASLRAVRRIHYVRAAIVFSLRDLGNGPVWDERFGLLSRNFRPRPSYRAVRRIFKRH
jgi:hypothetical protein